MNTLLLTTADEDLEIAARILNDGGNVIFPTETVYGLGADALNPEAVKKIFLAKGRPADNPLIVHVSSLEMLDGIAEEISDSAKELINKFWPGPLTVILKKCKNVPYETTAGLDTVAVRMPRSDTARRLIEISGIPIAAPSANLSGKPSPTSAKHCVDDMMGRVDAIIMGDDCEVGLESTVVDLSGEHPVVFRPGEITDEQIRDILGDLETTAVVKDGEIPKSPGLKYKHYAPNAEVVILSGTAEEAVEYVNHISKNQKAGVLVFDEFPKFENVRTVSLGSIKNPADSAHRLFAALRKMDEFGVDVIFAPEISDSGIWRAVRNRLYRAAGEKVLNLSDELAACRRPVGDKKNVLFVCTGNTCRSPMAEAVFNKQAAEKCLNFSAQSAGIFADGSEVSANSVLAMCEENIDISGRRSVQVTAEMIENSDIVLTMSKSHKNALIMSFGNSDKIKTLAEYAGENDDVSDPYGGDIEEYRKCRDIIEKLVKSVIERFGAD